ncbi:GNAT family N-acetyltransferase [Anaerobacillus isosaccharinicus]|uniref:GNAT family N-acetyltransferase n=1 Tax=Anaerobacillus isosaccharinicus TaxID=1532552 RepID=A0A1S2LI93_9BACI|nr:GNAT family N-acetyltransferase [Anaerobacillus isosaccharinicus]MBA5586091.1 GNAT family N-acetyltransferase [Anaerobacillus isosaccharinicus]QOY35639.1 GNAT family N-acetyltransferase [Anaerobacillus isosaccharinicus]
MSYKSAFLDQQETKTEDELKEEIEDLEFQMFRIQDNLKEIAKKWQVIGVEQTKENNWVIVYAADDGDTCKIMLNDCESAFLGKWDFSIQASYADENTIHIGDIKGPENKGYGSILINYLKELAKEQNIHMITGDIAKRDWDHKDRLVHFYKKHNFKVNIDKETKSGEIEWRLT